MAQERIRRFDPQMAQRYPELTKMPPQQPMPGYGRPVQNPMRQPQRPMPPRQPRMTIPPMPPQQRPMPPGYGQSPQPPQYRPMPMPPSYGQPMPPRQPMPMPPQQPNYGRQPMPPDYGQQLPPGAAEQARRNFEYQRRLDQANNNARYNQPMPPGYRPQQAYEEELQVEEQIPSLYNPYYDAY